MVKFRFLALGLVFTALVLASATPRAEAHGVFTPDGHSAMTGHLGPFHATYALTKGLQSDALVACSSGMAGPYPCKNIDMASYLNTNALFGNGSGSDITGWTDPVCGREIAIQGHSNATSFIDVSNPEVPVYMGTMPAILTGALWRELAVYNNHVYVVQDQAGLGMQIFDLTRLRLPPPAPDPCAAPVPQTVYTADATWTGPATGAGSGLSTVHTITISEQTGFAYLDGSDTCSGSPHVLDLKPNPKAPVWVGCISTEQNYVHDAQCVVYHGPDTAHVGQEICVYYTGQGTRADTITVYDVTDKGAPVRLSRTGYAGSAYTHQGWFTVDQRYVVADDEVDETGTENTTTFLWDMSDLDDATNDTGLDAEGPRLLSGDANPLPGWQHATICTDHNQFVRGNLSYQSNYACGLRIMSLNDIANGKLTELAYFDTMPTHDFIPGASDGGDLQGDWANYPYFASGNVVTSNITLGLFVLTPQLGPTAVTLTSFRGRQTGKHVTLNWRTASESDILGYNVFRYGQNRRVKLTNTLVPAKALGRAGGATYRLVDRHARPGVAYTYKLQVVTKSGLRAWKASTAVQVRR